MKIHYIPYPINTYTLSELRKMYNVSYNHMRKMVHEAEINIPAGQRFKKIFYPNEVQIIFEKFGNPQQEIKE